LRENDKVVAPGGNSSLVSSLFVSFSQGLLPLLRLLLMRDRSCAGQARRTLKASASVSRWWTTSGCSVVSIFVESKVELIIVSVISF
jgi:hypothetical protein